MKKYKSTFLLVSFALALFATGCGSGSTELGGSSGDDGEDSGDDSGGGGVSSGSTKWLVNAPVAQDGCGERIANVRQTFDVDISGTSATVDSSIISVTGTTTSSGFKAGYAVGGGDCVTEFTVEFSDVSDTSANVNLEAKTDCEAVGCTNRWSGTATRVN